MEAKPLSAAPLSNNELANYQNTKTLIWNYTNLRSRLLGVPTSEVGYTSATAARETTKSERTCGGIGRGGEDHITWSIALISRFYLLLLQSALQPLWVLACSTIVEYSQQEGFYRLPLSAARQTPQAGGPVIRTSNSHHQVSPTSETTRAKPGSGRWNYGREIAEDFAESGDFHLTFGFFYMP